MSKLYRPYDPNLLVPACLSDFRNGYIAQWSRHLCFVTLESYRSPCTPDGMVALIHWMAGTSLLFRWQLREVLKFEDYRRIRHKTHVHARDFPVSADLLGLVSHSFDRRISTSSTMDWSSDCSHETHKKRLEGLNASYQWRQWGADMLGTPYGIYVDGCSSLTDDGPLLIGVSEALMQSPNLSAPVYAKNVHVTRASLPLLYQALAQQDECEPCVELAVLPCSDYPYTRVLEFKFAEHQSHLPAFRTLERHMLVPRPGRIAQMSLRFMEDDEPEEPFVVFLLRVVGSCLHALTSRFRPISSHRTALVSSFYEALLVHCPNLKMLTVENSVVRLDEMVQTSTRLDRWTVERLSVSADSSEQVGLFADALAELSHPISKTLSSFALEAKVEDVGALHQLIQVTAQMKRSQTLKSLGYGDG